MTFEIRFFTVQYNTKLSCFLYMIGIATVIRCEALPVCTRAAKFTIATTFDRTFSMGGSSSYPARNFSEPTEKSVKPCTVRKSRSRKLGERSICLADSV